jgi:Domain of unknown function (DUF4352)
VRKPLLGVLFVTALLCGTAIASATAQPSGTPTVGSTIRTRHAAVTLHEYRQVVTSRRPTETAPAGSAVIAINVEICNTSRAALPVRRGQFFVATPERPLVFPAPTPNAPHPQLVSTRLARGRCLRGWVSYVVPTGSRATSAIFQAGAMFTPTLHTWTIPTS